MIIEHTIVLHGQRQLDGRVPSKEFGSVVAQTGELATEAVRMRLEGVSIRRGPHPKWLESIADVRFCDHEVERDGTTRLFFEAPRLKDVTPDELRQKRMFEGYQPNWSDSALDLLADAVFAIRGGERDSPLYDDHLLGSVRELHKAFGGVFERADLYGNRVLESRPAIADEVTIREARELRSSTPKPRVAQVLGTLDMIRHSTNMFGLAVEGHEVACVLQKGNIETLLKYVGEPLLVQGRVVFRPSGKVLRIEVDAYQSGEGKSGVFKRLPVPAGQRVQRAKLQRNQGPRSGINAIFGTLPGDESESEFVSLVEELNS